MKKALIGISTVAVLGLGGVLVTAQINNDKPTETKEENQSDSNDVKEVSATENEGTEEPNQEESKETTRTVELVDDKKPWEIWYQDEIAEMQNSGETVFLIEDGKTLESFFNSLISLDASATKDTEIARMNDYLDLFVKEIEENYSNETDYIDKLKEVKTAFTNKDYEAAKKLIEEAKALRES